jgi:hypothetical protein
LCNISFQKASRYCEQVRGALKEFLEHNLGAKHLTRDEWISQNTTQVTE